MKDKKIKIALVGQVFPYRGGIAQYNTQLHQALSEIGNNMTISFDKLYPGFLYPGESDIEIGAEGKEEPGVEYLIHVYKPWTLFNSVRRLKKSDVDVVFLTWWTLIWQPGIAFIAWLLRRQGLKVVYICHNVFDHDSEGLKKNISRFLLKYADGYVVHSSGDEKTLKVYYKKPILNTKVLPVYAQYPEPRKKIIKRGRLELLFFGFIRPYKGLEDLVTALAELNDEDVYLSVVGESWLNPKELEARIKKIGAPNIETHFNYVDDAEASFYFGRADLVVLPYKSATASAVASLAYNYKKPLLGTKVEGLRDVIDDGRTGWLIKPNSPSSLAIKISEITRKESEGMKPNIEKFCEEHSWSGMANQLFEFAEKINED